MKAFRYIVPAFMAAFAMTSCNEDVDIQPELTPTAVTEASIADGATVDALLHREVSLTYSHPVVLKDPSGITLNDAPVQNVKIDICNVSFPVTLEPGKNYTLKISSGALKRFGMDEVTPEAYTVNFTTREAPVVDAELINKNATPEAKALYKTLLSFYGSKTASGTMGEIAWGSRYYDVIAEAAEKAPAIIGFDFIHLSFSPANWIDYGDITPVKKAWEAGAIPAIMWHWNVPRTDKRGAKLDTAPSKFSPANVLVPGSWENGIAEADVAEVASYLKLLQDANIPVLFRPLHEAAGDYSYGAWFWWGAEGTEVTKQLWNWLYDKLTNQYGINNLVWEWTMQTNDSGNLAEVATMQGAYVGHDKCDIVGVDLYKNEALFNDFNTFYAVREAIEGKKMIALTETGNLFDPEIAFSTGETWLYFMQWYDLPEGSDSEYGIIKYTPAELWKQVMNSNRVIGRDEMKALLK